MVAIAEDATAAAEDAIHRAGDPDREAVHPASELGAIFGFHQEVQVVSLHAEVDDLEGGGAGCAELAANRVEDVATS